METLIAPEKIIDLEGISKMSLAQRYKIIEAIEATMTEEIEAMGFPPEDPEDEGKDDITLAEEALAEYKADPSSAIDGDVFFAQMKKIYNQQTNDFEIEEEEKSILKQRLDEYKANPSSAIGWKEAKAQIKREMNG